MDRHRRQHKTYAAMPSSTLIDAMFEPFVFDRDDSQFMFRSIGPAGRC